MESQERIKKCISFNFSLDVDIDIVMEWDDALGSLAELDEWQSNLIEWLSPSISWFCCEVNVNVAAI